MADRVVLDQVALTRHGPTLTLRLAAGQSLAVVGRANAGKSRFLSVLSRSESPPRGSVSVTGSVFEANGVEPGRRVRPQSLAASSGPGSSERAARALSAVALWNARKSPMFELSPGQRRAATLLRALVSEAEVVVIDGLLDELDPWTQSDVLSLLRARMRTGQSV
ncbi:MAG TPA: ATP-binding cassette domain-containing protein, partial [Fimbriimonadaceae bacterium]|nr:ATP-binding cassette domain-containing protein [Fimbriimonadaceae bacterium]